MIEKMIEVSSWVLETKCP